VRIDVRIRAHLGSIQHGRADGLEELVGVVILAPESVLVDADGGVENCSHFRLSLPISVQEAPRILSSEKFFLLSKAGLVAGDVDIEGVLSHLVQLVKSLIVAALRDRLHLAELHIVIVTTLTLYHFVVRVLLDNAVVDDVVHVEEPVRVLVGWKLLEYALLSQLLVHELLSSNVLVFISLELLEVSRHDGAVAPILDAVVICVDECAKEANALASQRSGLEVDSLEENVLKPAELIQVPVGLEDFVDA